MMELPVAEPTCTSATNINYTQASRLSTCVPRNLFKTSYNVYDDGGLLAPEGAEISVLPVQPPKSWWQKLEYLSRPINFLIQIKSPDRSVGMILGENEDCQHLLARLEADRDYCITRRKEYRENKNLDDRLKSAAISLNRWGVDLQNVVRIYTPEAYKDFDKSSLFYRHEADGCWLVVPEEISIVRTNRPGSISQVLIVRTVDQPCIKVGPFLSKQCLAEWLLN